MINFLVYFRLAIGGAGGSRIPSSVLFSTVQHLFMKKSLTDAISTRRLHHQLLPMNLYYETNFDESLVNQLNKTFGHWILQNEPSDGFAAVVGVANENGKVEGSFDPRRGGSVEILK